MIKGVIALLLILFVSGISAHSTAPYEIGTDVMFYGIYKGWTVLSMTEYDLVDDQNESVMLTMLNQNKTYLILVYVVPDNWPGMAELMTKKPWSVNDLRGEFR